MLAGRLLLVAFVVVFQNSPLIVVVALFFVLLLLGTNVVHLLVKFGSVQRVRKKQAVL